MPTANLKPSCIKESTTTKSEQRRNKERFKFVRIIPSQRKASVNADVKYEDFSLYGWCKQR